MTCLASNQYSWLEPDQGWTLEPGILRGDTGGDIRECWWLRPQYSIIGYRSPQTPPQDSQVPVSTPGLFQPWTIDTKPCCWCLSEWCCFLFSFCSVRMFEFRLFLCSRECVRLFCCLFVCLLACVFVCLCVLVCLIVCLIIGLSDCLFDWIVVC